MILKYTVRRLIKHWQNSVLSILCLTVAYFLSIIIIQWIREEYSYDRFHNDGENIYRLTLENHNAESGYFTHFARISWFSNSLPEIQEEIPQVRELTRFSHWSGGIAVRNEEAYSIRLFHTDTCFFKVFTTLVISGDRKNLLGRPNTIVLSESMAKKLFGKEDPVGQELEITCRRCSEIEKYEIIAVIEDFPQNSHFHFDILASYNPGQDIGWAYFYLKLEENADPEIVKDAIQEYSHKWTAEEAWDKYSFHIQALRDIHLHSAKDRELEQNSNINYVRLFILLGIIILSVSLFNFLNLRFFSLSIQFRSRTLMKIFGGSERMLIAQPLFEVILIVVAAILISVLLLLLFYNAISSAVFGRMVDLDLYLLISAYLLIGTISTAVGVYPFLSDSIRSMIKRNKSLETAWNWDIYQGVKRKMSLSKALVSVQYAISFLVLILVVVITGQVNLLMKSRMGGDMGKILVLDELPVQTGESYEVFKNELLKSPLIREVTVSFENPGDENMDMFRFESPGTSPETAEKLLAVYPCGDNYFDFYEIPFIAGENFSDYSGNDSMREDYILNETALKHLGWSVEEALGREFRLVFNMNNENWFNGGRIVGIVRDFQPSNMKNEIKPYVFFQKSYWLFSAQVKYDTTRFEEAMTYIRETWERIYPGIPMDFSFTEDIYNKLYSKEIRINNLSSLIAILTIFLSSIGLMGILNIIFRTRTKEIAIRKVNGAGKNRLIIFLLRDFWIIMLPSVFIAFPAGFFLSVKWLENFAYQASPDPFVLTGAVLGIIILSISTVIRLAWSITSKNPSETLGYE